jgi:hypothetical protein
MRDWRTYWAEVLAPTLREKKRELGRALPERTIAFDVAKATGQDSSRSLLAMWFRGEREPTVSQFMALCERIELDPAEVLFQQVRRKSVRKRTVAEVIDDRHHGARNIPTSDRKTRP